MNKVSGAAVVADSCAGMNARACIKTMLLDRIFGGNFPLSWPLGDAFRGNFLNGNPVLYAVLCSERCI